MDTTRAYVPTVKNLYCNPKSNPKFSDPVRNCPVSTATLSGPFRTVTDSCSGFRDQKVAGSNPVTSTTEVGRYAIAYQLFLMQ